MIQQFHFWVFAQKTQNTNSKRCMNSHVHSSVISHNKKPRYGSNLSAINRQMDKEGVVSVLYKILAIKVKSSHVCIPDKCDPSYLLLFFGMITLIVRSLVNKGTHHFLFQMDQEYD